MLAEIYIIQSKIKVYVVMKKNIVNIVVALLGYKIAEPQNQGSAVLRFCGSAVLRFCGSAVLRICTRKVQLLYIESALLFSIAAPSLFY